MPSSSPIALAGQICGKLGAGWIFFIVLLLAPRALKAHPLPIQNGTEVAACGFPPVASLHFPSGYCTGTLIHPSIVVYAAHCGSGLVDVAFGDDRYYFPKAPHRGATCIANPLYQDIHDEANDWAYCLLEEPVTEIPPVGVLAECSLDSLDRYGVVWQVGFGAVAGTAAMPEHSGIKRWGQTVLTDLDLKGSRFTTSTKFAVDDPMALWRASSGCPGDSGGPALVQLEDGSWHTIGVLSTMMQRSCGGDNHYAMLGPALAAIAQATGIDLRGCAGATNGSVGGTPCPEIMHSPLGLIPGSGNWATSCQFTARIATNPQCQTVWQDPKVLEYLVIPPHGGCSIHYADASPSLSWLVIIGFWLRARRQRVRCALGRTSVRSNR